MKNSSLFATHYYTSIRATEIVFENSGSTSLLVPGFGHPIDYELNVGQRFAHGMTDFRQKPRLTVRELSMLQLMNALTDKPHWNKKVFDDDIVHKWHQEALTKPLISKRAWNWCLAELRDKAKYFEEHDFVLTLDTGSRCAKSDIIIDDNLQHELNQAVQPLLHGKYKDWHPTSNEQVLNLVHPSLFPLVYGESIVLETGQVGLRNCVEACGYGIVTHSFQDITQSLKPRGCYHGNLNNAGRWSAHFQ